MAKTAKMRKTLVFQPNIFSKIISLLLICIEELQGFLQISSFLFRKISDYFQNKFLTIKGMWQRWRFMTVLFVIFPVSFIPLILLSFQSFPPGNEKKSFLPQTSLVTPNASKSMGSLNLEANSAVSDSTVEYLYSGESISELFTRMEVQSSYIPRLVKEFETHFNIRKIRALRDPFIFNFSNNNLRKIVFKKGDKKLNLSFEEGTIESRILWREFEEKYEYAEGVITDSFYNALRRQDVDPQIIMELIFLYSFDVDFQREIQSGMRFEIIYTSIHDETEEVVGTGDIHYASLFFPGGRSLPIYYFIAPDGEKGYYTPEGKSLQKALLRTPINGSRLTSAFGYRRHPISGYTNYHKGVDFGASSGTPIFAGGSGTIVVRGWSKAGYGNYVVIRHPNGYKTLYAHMSGFRKGQAVGSRVSQGDVIGYVGSTGISTGPHLHYEIIYQGKQINPMTMRLKPGRELKGNNLDLFKMKVSALNSEFGELSS